MKQFDSSMKFSSSMDIKTFALLNPDKLRITPHYSSAYIWNVWHPPSFGPFGYGFSSEKSLLAWANSTF